VKKAHTYHWLAFLCLSIGIGVFTPLQVLAQATQAPKAQKGWLDLRQWDFEKNPAIRLDGEWLFYLGAFLNGRDFDTIRKPSYLQVPLPGWEGQTYAGNQKLPKHGFGTYQLKVILPPTRPRLAIKTPDQGTAFKVFINNQLIHSIGLIGTSPELTTPSARGSFINFLPNSDTLTIDIQIANFHHRKSGIWLSISLGEEDNIRKASQWLLIVNVFTLGCLLIMGFYQLLIFVIRPQDKSSLYFSLLSFFIALRLTTTGENFLANTFTWLPWIWELRMEYISFYMLTVYIILFIKHIFPDEMNRSICKFFEWAGYLFTAATLVVSANIFSYFVFPYYFFIVFACFYILWAVSLALYRRRSGSIIFLIGTLVLSFTAINDVLYNALIINTMNLSPFGFVTAVFAQASILSIRSTRAFRQVQNLSDELSQVNQNLENTIASRTLELENKNKELSTTVNKLNYTLDLLKEQAERIRENNQDMRASISYGKRIQEAMLASPQIIREALPDLFIFFKPREIVSGDFYWFAQKPYKAIIAAIDCTGHGIPGAFMSLIANNLLNDIVLIQNITEPNKILDELRAGIQKSLRQRETNNQDGMDIALCSIDQFTPEAIEVMGAPKLKYAGSNNPLLYIQNDEVRIIEGDKLIIGGFNNYISQTHFNLYEVDISKSTTFYLFSDGFQDQFGGPNGKKFMKKRFYEVLKQIYKEPTEIQEQVLELTLSNWMNESLQTQTDDILIIGVRLGSVEVPKQQNPLTIKQSQQASLPTSQ